MAERLGAWIIEDDYDSEYRFVGRPIPAMQGARPHGGAVIYVGTFAKMLFPAMRLGYMVVPEALVRGRARAQLTGQFAPLMLQAALADFIDRGPPEPAFAADAPDLCRPAAVVPGHAPSAILAGLDDAAEDAGIQLVGNAARGR